MGGGLGVHLSFPPFLPSHSLTLHFSKVRHPITRCHLLQVGTFICGRQWGDVGGGPERLRLRPACSDPTIVTGWPETPASRRGDPGHGEVTAGGNCHNPQRNGAISLRHRREGKDKEPYEYLNCNLPRFLQLTFFFFFFWVEGGGVERTRHSGRKQAETLRVRPTCSTSAVVSSFSRFSF